MFWGQGSGRSVAWLARLFRVQEVVSSNLTAPTTFFRFENRPSVLKKKRLLPFPMQPSPTPKTEDPGVIYSLRSILEPIELASLFRQNQPLEVELGSGDGSFLVEYARQHPTHNFIGVERLLGRIRKMERKGHRVGLVNLRGVRIESSYFLQYLLPAHSAAALHIYFPDPWPKRKHRRHRLINDQFPALAHTALAPGGMVYLRTDDEDYFAQMLAVFEASPRFRPVATPPDLAALLTDFEKEFLAKGTRTLRAAYRGTGAEGSHGD